MAMLGMQAELQCKSYFPGHYSTRDLNLDTNSGIWPLSSVDKIFINTQCYNGTVLPASADCQLVHNKEILRQTMLKQESIFRDQINELHRLYRRQKELMDEMKNELLKTHVPLETLGSNPLLSQKSSDYAWKTSHVLSMPWMNHACNLSSVSTAENNPPLSCFKDGKSVKAGPDPRQTKFFSKGNELESKCKKFGKKILDLERPPDEYIDCEEDEPLERVLEVSGYPLKRISEVLHESDQQPYQGSGGFKSSTEKRSLADLNEPIKLDEESDSMSMYMADLNEPTKHEEEAAPMSKFLADLNEPIKLEEEAASTSCVSPSPVTVHRKFPCENPTQTTNSGFIVFSKDLVENTKTRRDIETCSDVLNLETNKMQERPSDASEAGQCGSNAISLSPPGFSEEGSTSLEDVDQKQTLELQRSYLMDQSKRKSCSEGLRSLQRELSSNSSPELVSNSSKGTSCQLIPLTDIRRSEASSVFSWRKYVRDVMRTPIAVQALPCFNTSAPSSKSSKSSIARPSLSDTKSHHGNNFKSNPEFDGTSFHHKSFCNESHSESHPPSFNFGGLDCNKNDDLVSENCGPAKFIRCSMDVKPAKDVNSDFIPEICSSGGKKKLEDSPKGLPALKTKSVCKRKRGKRSEFSTQMESVLKQANSSCIIDVEMREVEANINSSGKPPFSFHIFKNPHMSNGQCSSLSPTSKTLWNPSNDEGIENGEKDGVIDINLEYDPATELEEQRTSNASIPGGGLDKKVSDFGVGIDLNSSLDEQECFPAPSLSTELDLEAPPSPENKERSPPRGDSEENPDENPVEMPFQISEKEDDLHEGHVINAAEAILSGQEVEDVQEELVRTAAKAIVSISSSTFQTCTKTASCEPSESYWSDELFWFAGVVSFVIDDPESKYGVVLSCKKNDDNNECLSNGLDYFEAMTLKLTETKVEEQWCKSNGQKDQKEEDTGATSLPSQTRRGRIRRGRQQRKDFQNEILPSLASLSRYEVTEDLQTIEGLIEAANNQGGTGSTRNVYKNVRARGRKRTCIATSNITENTISSVSKLQTTCREKGTDDRGLISWGKIARRRRGPRCPASNSWLIQGQVH